MPAPHAPSPATAPPACEHPVTGAPHTAAAPRTPPATPPRPAPPESALGLSWASEEDTLAFARRLAHTPALGHALITLHGDLGAGKTTLVRHLLRALGVGGRIKSPTYAVVEPYEVPWPWAVPATQSGNQSDPQGPLGIWHFDFYRLSDPREWEDAGLRDLLASPGLKLVEWPEQAPDLPTPDLAVYLHTTDGDQRLVRLLAHTECGYRCLRAAQSDIQSDAPDDAPERTRPQTKGET